MPYIPYQSRLALDVKRRSPANAGELNYKITKLVLAYLGGNPSYERYNAVVGALECAKLELYRRKVVPYEEMKMAVNGDVYQLDKEATDEVWSVVWWLNCDEYHAHNGKCYCLRVMRTEQSHKDSVVSSHRTRHEATAELGRLDSTGGDPSFPAGKGE